MPRFATTLSLWPGFLAGWRSGSARGVALAIGFASALNLALVATFGGEGRMLGVPAGAIAAAAWVLVLSLWAVGLVWLRREASQPTSGKGLPPSPEVDGWFIEAQTQYLQGHWIEAETLVCQVLAKQPDDAEARLLLASIERRTRRRGEAKDRLLNLKQSGTAAKWWLEIERELEQLAASERGPVESEAPSTSLPLPKAA